MGDPSVTLSLGGRWLHQSAEREKQGQTIAHLTNQLEGLRAAYTDDLEQVAENKRLLGQMQAALDRVESERDEWKAAYNGVVNKRIERDFLVEDMMSKMNTLELTTRQEELTSADATRRATMAQKEKELLHAKLERMKAELDDTYTKLAAANERIATHDEEAASLHSALATMTRSRDTKENQVVLLLKEKSRLFRLVTDLRSTMGVAGATTKADIAKPGILAQNGESDLSSSVRSSASSTGSRSRSRRPKSASGVHGIGNMIGATLNGTIDRPRWASTAPSIADKVSNARNKPMTSQEQLDEMAVQGNIGSRMIGTPLRRSRSRGATVAGGDCTGRDDADASDEKESSSFSSSLGPHSGGGPLRANDLEYSTDHASHDVDVARDSQAKQTLLLRLKRQIDLLTEKNAELEKAGGLVKQENQLLLVRFRGAHDRRVKAEKALRATEHELEQLRATATTTTTTAASAGGQAGGHSEEYSSHEEVQLAHGITFVDHSQSVGRRPQSAAAKPNTPGRWK